MDSRSARAAPRRVGASPVNAYHAAGHQGTPMNLPPGPQAKRPQPPDDLLSPATQIVANRADYLGEGKQDVGQRVSDDKLELFVNTDPAQALLQEFARHTPDFIALHDVGGSASLHLLTAVAGALNSKMQQLAIRRQGHGVALATLRFVEIPGRGSHKLRVYTTDTDADTGARRQLANVLLGHSKLGVLMVGDLPGHAMATALQPVKDAIREGPWPNRALLLVPRGSPQTISAQAAPLAGSSGVFVKVTPQVSQPNDAWTYITGAWNRLRDGPPSAAAKAASPVDARPAQAMPATATPQVLPTPVAQPRPASAASAAPDPVGPWRAYVQACGGIKGLISACVFDSRGLKVLAHNNARPDPQRLMTQGVALFDAMSGSARSLGLGSSQPDAAISLAAHHLLVHPLPGHPGVLLHAVLDGTSANLTLARMQLQRVDSTVLAPVGRS